MPLGIPMASNSNVQSKTRATTIKLTPEQHKLIEQRARFCGVKMTVWMRSVLLQAATKNSKEGYIRIREPDGAIT